MDIVSVVVPIFRVEKYLDACIRSLLNQTYKKLDIILVDDGSDDSCPDICDRYAKDNTCVRVIHKKNGGLSDARNAGMRIAKGKYITFVDSDDIVDPRFIEKLYLSIIESHADISFCDYLRVDESCTEHFASEAENDTDVFSGRECLHKLFNPDRHGMEFIAWGKLYKKELFSKHHIEYPVGRIHEDTFTTYKLFYYARKVVFIDNQLYFYRTRSGSIMTSNFSPKRLDSVEAYREACSFFEKKGESAFLKYAFNAYLRNAVRIFSEISLCGNKKELEPIAKELITDFRQTFSHYYKNVDIRLKKKLFYAAFALAPSSILARMIVSSSSK